jgi:hypothetical protein
MGNKKILIIGSKPYINVSLNGLLDGFENNIRCNFSLPDNNNGTKCDKLGLCNHLYENLILKKLPKNEFFKSYGEEYRSDYIDYFFENFKKFKSQYSHIFHAKFRPEIYNKLLDSLGCPYYFSAIPRTGYTILCENLLQGNEVFITNFSIYNETRVSHYVKEGYYDSAYHKAEDETNILRWLHENKKIDATLCFLEDVTPPTLTCLGLEPSNFIVEKITQEYGTCLIKGYNNEKNN